MAKEIGIRIFVGDRPIEALTAEEVQAFSERTTERMGNALNDYFTLHPEEYGKIQERA